MRPDGAPQNRDRFVSVDPSEPGIQGGAEHHVNDDELCQIRARKYPDLKLLLVNPRKLSHAALLPFRHKSLAFLGYIKAKRLRTRGQDRILIGGHTFFVPWPY
jgi:hypothetical protein